MNNKKGMIITIFINGIVFLFTISILYSLLGQNSGTSFTVMLVIASIIAVLQGMMTFSVFSRQYSMPITNFSCMGFIAKTENEIEGLKNMVKAHGMHIETKNYKGVSYQLLRFPNEEELWLSTDSGTNKELLTPFYRGKNINRIDIIDKIDNNQGVCEGLFFALAGSDSEEGGKIPIVFECPDYQNHAASEFKGENDIYLSAFPYMLKVFKNITAFEKAQGLDVKYGTESIIPVGISELDKIPREMQKELQPLVFFNGIVKHVEMMQNNLTNIRFYKISVKILSLELNVLADHRMVARVPQPGQIISCTAWLTGDWTVH